MSRSATVELPVASSTEANPLVISYIWTPHHVERTELAVTTKTVENLTQDLLKLDARIEELARVRSPFFCFFA
jgi:hypothetical protein